MNLSETIQDDFNKIFKPENIEYPYSLMDVLQVHTQSNDQNKLYSYLHGGLEYMFDNSSLYMSSNKKKENSFFHSIADMFIFVKNTISKDSVKQNIYTQAKINNEYSILQETKAYVVIYKHDSAYRVYKDIVLDNPNTSSNKEYILFKIICDNTLVFVLYNRKKNHIDIMYSSTLDGEILVNVKQFQKILLHNLRKIFDDIHFNLYVFGHHITTTKDILHSYIWFTITLAYFFPNIDIGNVKDYILTLSTIQRHNMIIDWVNFITKYSKHITNVEFDFFLLSELIHIKTKKKISKQSPSLTQQGGSINKIENNKKIVTSYIKKLFTIV